MPQSKEAVIGHLSELPAFPKVTAKLFALLRDPGVSVITLAETIAADPALAAKVIRLTNSPFYMTSRPIKSISDAVFVLGISSVKSLTSTATIRSGFASFVPRKDIFDLTEFWKHSYATAIVARHLAIKSKNELSEFLYLAGLIHDLGKLIIAYYWPECWRQIVTDVAADPTESMKDSELRYLMITHSELIGRLCRNWHMPDELTELVENMQYSDEYQGVWGAEINLLQQSDDFATRAGLAFPKKKISSSGESMEIEGLSLVSLNAAVEFQLSALEH